MRRSSSERDARAGDNGAGATQAGSFSPASWSTAVSRAAWFTCVWLVFAGSDPWDFPAAAGAVVVATWASLHLLPPGTSRKSTLAIARLALRFLCQSVIGGVDVARRALDPRLPLQPGFVTYPIGLPSGTARNVFATLTSLLPGTVPTGEEQGQLVYHCLDVGQPVAAQLADEEAALARVFHHD